MDTYTILFLVGALVFLVLLSGFFSSAETGLMSLNRYRLRHKAKEGDKTAACVADMLNRPDRLLGVILIGNNFANILASSIATFIAVTFFGELGVAISTILLTLLVLIFAEVSPKTLAAIYPEKVAFGVAYPLKWLLKLLYPLVWLTNAFSNGLLKLFGVNLQAQKKDALSQEELRTVVHEAGEGLSSKSQDMLLSILDLREVTVDDIMIPRQEVSGIDLNADWDIIFDQILTSKYNRLPVFREDLDNIVGIFHLRDALPLINKNKFDKTALEGIIRDPYFVPEGTPLYTQLLRFQQLKRRRGLVVDEYGEVQGMVTLEDLLEEIVGECSTEIPLSKEVTPQADGSFLIDGSVNLRELNRHLQWDFPTDGPKTLSGLITDYLQAIPAPQLCLRLAGYPLEIVKIKANRVKAVRIYPELYQRALTEESA